MTQDKSDQQFGSEFDDKFSTIRLVEFIST